MKNKKKNGERLEKEPFAYLKTFSKLITVVWLIVWAETVLFSQVATVLNLGDAMAIQSINSNVVEIGAIITGFYFCKAALENIAQGIEGHREKMVYEDTKYEEDGEETVG